MIQQLKFLPIYKNVDEVSQMGGCVDLKNGYIDEAGAWRSRPGLSPFKVLGTVEPVVGIHWWDERRMALYISDGKLFAQTSEAADPVQVTLDSAVVIPERCSPVFVSTAQRVFIAWNDQVLTWTGSGTAVFCTLGTLPTRVSQLAFLDGYIIAINAADDLMYFAEPSLDDIDAEPTWYAGDKAEGASDLMTTLKAGWRDLMVGGRRSIEMWYNAGNALPQSPFARREGAFIERGVIAPHSFLGINNTWFWLDHERKVSMLSGVTPQVLSGPFDALFQTFSTVEDARAFGIAHGGRSWYVLSFPTENRTFAYEYATQQWAEWAEWHSATASWDRWAGEAVVHAVAWNKHLVASRHENGTVYFLSSTVYADDAVPVMNELTTSWVDHGTNMRKRSRMIRFRVKRGELASATAPVLSLRFRDDGNSVWSSWEDVDLGTLGQTSFHATLQRRGIYRARQYQLRMSGQVGLVMQLVEEDVEALR